MKQNQFDVKTALTQALLDTTGVRLTRLGTIETIYHNKTIFVTFTLFDKPLFYGKNNVVVEPTLAGMVCHFIKNYLVFFKLFFNFKEAESKLEASIAKTSSVLIIWLSLPNRWRALIYCFRSVKVVLCMKSKRREKPSITLWVNEILFLD